MPLLLAGPLILIFECLQEGQLWIAGVDFSQRDHFLCGVICGTVGEDSLQNIPLFSADIFSLKHHFWGLFENHTPLGGWLTR